MFLKHFLIFFLKIPIGKFDFIKMKAVANELTQEVIAIKSREFQLIGI